jgi:hypothetical protein
MENIARLCVMVGVVLLVVGGVVLLATRLGIPYIGRLPGDLLIQRDGGTLYLPIATSIILSLLLTIVLNVIARLMR